MRADRSSVPCDDDQPSRASIGPLLVGILALTAAWVVMAVLAWQRPVTYSEAAETAPWPDMRINMNTATEADLSVLPGIGPRLAEYIVADREANGPFRSLDDLMRVHMIGPRTVEQISPYIIVRPHANGSPRAAAED